MKLDLYFIANPALGTIKIGVTQNLAARLRSLEHACGVPLELLKLVAGGGHHEFDLHEALAPSRLIGEWFTPTPDLLAIVHDEESIDAFIKRSAVAVMERRVAAGTAKAAALAQREADRAEMKRTWRRLAKKRRHVA